MSKKADLTQVTLQAMFADSVLIRVSPAEDGFVCSIVENNTDSYQLNTTHNILRRFKYISGDITCDTE